MRLKTLLNLLDALFSNDRKHRALIVLIDFVGKARLLKVGEQPLKLILGSLRLLGNLFDIPTVMKADQQESYSFLGHGHVCVTRDGVAAKEKIRMELGLLLSLLGPRCGNCQ